MKKERYSSLIALLLVVGLSNAQEQSRDADLIVVRGTILDDASDKPIAARVHLQGDDGEWHLVNSVGGSAVHYERNRQHLPNSPEVHTTLSAHPFSVKLKPGKYTIRVERGKEYHSLVKELDVSTATAPLEFRLRRWINMASRSWYSGDTHVHRQLGELANIMVAEDLNVTFPLSYWVTTSDTPPSRGDRTNDTNLSADLILVDRTHVIHPVNTEYEIFSVGARRHTLGAVFVLNHKTPFPMGAPPVAPIARMARQENALLEFDKHSWPWSMMIVPIMKVDLFELLNNHLWQTNFGFRDWTVEAIPDYMNIERTADGVGMTEWGWTDFGLKTYYALVNAGFRMRITAGTASGVHPVQLGFNRVYVHLPNGFDYEDWIAGLNAGQSFVTNGPMLEATFNSKQPGHEFKQASADTFRMQIDGRIASKRPLRKIEVVINGDTSRIIKPQNKRTETGSFETILNDELKLDASAWVAIRCFEDHPDKRIRFAHTNPVYVEIAGRPHRPKKVEVQYFLDRIDEELERNRSILSSTALREYELARSIYQDLMQKAD